MPDEVYATRTMTMEEVAEILAADCCRHRPGGHHHTGPFLIRLAVDGNIVTVKVLHHAGPTQPESQTEETQ